jgi:hypothetical protein
MAFLSGRGDSEAPVGESDVSPMVFVGPPMGPPNHGFGGPQGYQSTPNEHPEYTHCTPTLGLAGGWDMSGKGLKDRGLDLNVCNP